MLKPEFSVNSLTRSADAVARIVPADRLFTLRSRAFVVPAGWAALATRRRQDPLLVRAGEQCQAADTLEVLFARTGPIECAAKESALRSADGYECCGSIRVSVRILPEPAELAAFRKTVVGRSESVSVPDLQRCLHWQISQVLAGLASGHSAAELVKPLEESMVRSMVNEKLGPACLAGGLAIEGPAAVQFDSPGYREHCRQRARVDRRQERLAARVQIQRALAAAQRERLTHLVEMLERVREASASQANAGMAELLRAFSAAERRRLYDALWHLCPGEGTTRFAAAVSGPLRSVRVDPRSREAGVLLVGAAAGVHLVDIDTGNLEQSLPAGAAKAEKLRGGVNAAAMSDDRVFATHSELGLMAWRRDAGSGEPADRLYPHLTAGASTVRCVQVAEGRVWFAVDETLWSLPLADGDSPGPVRYAAGRATISALRVAEGAAYAGSVDGQIIAWDAGDPDSARIVRGGGGPVESIDLVQAGGLEHLIVADRSSALLAMVLGDNHACRYESPSHHLRRAAAAEDVFVAMNDPRDRLITWDPREPDHPTATVIIPHLTGDCVQDICLVTPAT